MASSTTRFDDDDDDDALLPLEIMPPVTSKTLCWYLYTHGCYSTIISTNGSTFISKWTLTRTLPLPRPVAGVPLAVPILSTPWCVGVASYRALGHFDFHYFSGHFRAARTLIWLHVVIYPLKIYWPSFVAGFFFKIFLCVTLTLFSSSFVHILAPNSTTPLLWWESFCLFSYKREAKS